MEAKVKVTLDTRPAKAEMRQLVKAGGQMARTMSGALRSGMGMVGLGGGLGAVGMGLMARQTREAAGSMMSAFFADPAQGLYEATGLSESAPRVRAGQRATQELVQQVGPVAGEMGGKLPEGLMEQYKTLTDMYERQERGKDAVNKALAKEIASEVSNALAPMWGTSAGEAVKKAMKWLGVPVKHPGVR